MARTSTWSGWIVFAAWLMLIVGAVTAFEGLIAIIRDHYYVFGPNQLIIFDVTKWGWIMLLWGIVLAAGGLALAAGKSWARYFTLFVASFNFVVQLGFLGSAQYTLWVLTTIGLSFVVIYALVVHWHEAREQY